MPRTIMREGLVALAAAACAASCVAPSEPVRLVGAECVRPPTLHCPDAGCAGEVVTSGGPVVEPTTGRSYFLDYPCDLARGEDVTLVLSLHGGGSYGNWQRHYFPLLDYVDEHRLVVVTPNAPPRFWTPADDAYLETLVASLLDEIGRENVASLWLAGHSQGGMTSNRIACSDFFRDKVDGWLSLSGGRIGSAGLAPGFGPPGATPAAANGEAAPSAPALPAGAFPPIVGANGPEQPGPGIAVTPACDMSFIFTTGALEIAGLPETSPWAEKYACSPRVREADVADDEAGYVHDTRPRETPNPAWGREPRPGVAEVYIYPACARGRLVADVVRLDKGHTEGLEPQVTERLIELMLAAPGGKIQGQG
jgi:hypothetical protein